MSFRNMKLREIMSWPLIAFLWLVSLLPFWFLYLVSDLVSVLLHKVFRYRLNVVRINLRNAFPEKSNHELYQIEKNFYLHFSDLTVEVIKLKTMRFGTLKKRCCFTPESVELLNTYYENGKSILIAMAHIGNWEWAGAAFPLYNKHQIITAYRPLTNNAFDADTLRMRQRTGNILASMINLPRVVIKNRDKIIGTALIADQKPPARSAYWMVFLNQETPFFKGTEQLSKKFDLPVFWGGVKRVRRGYYEADVRLITNDPKSIEPEGALTQLYAQILEKAIVEQPESWLWSHKRWKGKRPIDIEMIYGQ